MDFKESDLYIPVCEYFKSLGYDVQAEVKNCDLVAEKDGEIIIAELKKTFSLKLVYQAMDRQSISNLVYVVIPRPKKGAKGSQWRNMLKLMKKLNIGIITVAMDSPLKTVDIVAIPEALTKPQNNAKKSSLKKEVYERNLRTNTGGVNKTKILTAYREKSIYTLCILELYKEIKPSELNRIMNEKYAGYILSRNYYGWFEKISKGIYGISEKGMEVIKQNEYPEAINYYREKAKEVQK